MGRFDKGVEYYTVCNLDINIHFPEDQVKCGYCPFLIHQESVDRDRCSITNEILFSREFTGRSCPLTILNTTNAEDLNE